MTVKTDQREWKSAESNLRTLNMKVTLACSNHKRLKEDEWKFFDIPFDLYYER